MTISKGVCYQQCSDTVYLRNINTRMDYLLNLTVLDILEYYKTEQSDDIKRLCDYLETQYEITDRAAFEEDMGEFVSFLKQEKILTGEQDKDLTEVQALAEEKCLAVQQLFSAGLELTYRCNEKCLHCYIDDGNAVKEKPELSLAEYKRIIDELRELGCIRILLTGGEVCIRKDFISIADYAVKAGMLVDIYTNGTEMTEEQFDLLCAMKINSISFSLYSGEPDVHDKITQVPGSFEKTLRRMMMFKCAGVDVFIKAVVMQQNLPSLESLYRLGERLHISVMPSVTIIDSHLGKAADHCRLTSYHDYYQAMVMERRFAKKPPKQRERSLDECICMGGQTSISIDPYGGVHPCIAFRETAGSVRELPLREIWENSTFLKNLRKIRFRDIKAPCTKCAFINECALCIGDCYSEISGEICPHKENCIAARAIQDSLDIIAEGGERDEGK